MNTSVFIVKILIGLSDKITKTTVTARIKGFNLDLTRYWNDIMKYILVQNLKDENIFVKKIFI